MSLKFDGNCLYLWLSRLIDGDNITTDDQHMWLIPFSYGEPHTLNIAFSKAQTVAGLRVWNYNKSPEDSYRGVSQLSVTDTTGKFPLNIHPAIHHPTWSISSVNSHLKGV